MYTLAAEENHIEANFKLFLMHQAGTGTATSKTATVGLLPLTSCQEHVVMQYGFEVFHEKVDCIESGIVAATLWYKLET